ncbi:MAG TPA: hypothetical protein VK585_16860 [Jiangellaceae bacterium]|nr:hypothetical protein [Jiangellaceae bacterium]
MAEWPVVTAVLPRRFALVRHVDYTGVSGVGVVAFGIAFSDGHVVLRWCSSHPATSTWGSLDDMLAVHGHGDATSIQWIDAPAREIEDLPGAMQVGRRARRRAERDVVGDDETPTGDPDIAPPPVDPGSGPGPAANGHERPREGAPDAAALPGPQVPGRHRRSDQVEPRL